MNSSRLAAPVFTAATSDAGHAEHLEDHAGGQLPGERGDDVGPPLVQPVGDEAAHGVADEPLHLGDAPGREREVGDPAGAAVRGRVDVGERGDGPEAALDERWRPARGHGGVTGARLLAAEKVLYSRSTRLQSS